MHDDLPQLDTYLDEPPIHLAERYEELLFDYIELGNYKLVAARRGKSENTLKRYMQEIHDLLGVQTTLHACIYWDRVLHERIQQHVS